MSDNTFAVKGMTCGHCEMSVVEEVSELPGVSDVTADHQSGTLTFTSDQPVSRAAVAEAVAEAGYELT